MLNGPQRQHPVLGPRQLGLQPVERRLNRNRMGEEMQQAKRVRAAGVPLPVHLDGDLAPGIQFQTQVRKTLKDAIEVHGQKERPAPAKGKPVKESRC
jgi:tRNA A-37 threonylcarbamoyl transferase component Bud32